MSVSKVYLGEYILKEDRDAPEIRVPTIAVNRSSESVELTPQGIKTRTGLRERLVPIRLAATVSARHASGWRKLNFECSSETEDGKKLQSELIWGVRLTQVYVDAIQYQETLETLLALDSDRLSFLYRASDLVEENPELSILNAFFAFELELDRIVPQNLSTSGKISCLEFAGVASTEALNRFRSLNGLRNKLAHGKWNYDDLGKSLARLLGGRTEKWLMRDTGSVTIQGACRVLNELVKALADLHQSEERLNQAKHSLKEPDEPSGTDGT